MTQPRSRLQQFIRELKRRGVLRVAAVYAVAGWAVVEVSSTVAPLLMLPGWTPTLILVLVLLAFPVVLGVAWAFDVTPEGIRRTPANDPGADPSAEEATARRSRAVGRMAAVVALLALVLGGVALLRAGGDETADTVAYRVAVVPFENQTGDPELDDLGAVAADWITDGLTSIDTVQVVPTTAVRELLSEAPPGADPLPWLTRSTGAGLAVTGSYLLSGDSVEIRAHLEDTGEGQVVASFEPARAPRSEPTGALTRVRQQVVGCVAARMDPDYQSFTSGPPPSYDAYRAYVSGAELFTAGRFTQAVGEFERAIAADSGFVAPWLALLGAYAHGGRWAAADSIIRLLEPRRSELSEVQRLVLDHADAALRGDMPGAYRTAREWLRRSPSDLARYYAALYAHRVNRPRESVEFLEEVPEGSRTRTSWFLYHGLLTLELHRLGRHEEELAAARRARELFPDRPEAISLEARALAALGRPADVEARADELLSLPRGGVHLRLVGDELAAHGHDQAARRVYARALDWRREAGGNTPRWLGGEAHVLRRLGRLDEASELADSVRVLDPDSKYSVALAGVVAAQRGDRDRAERAAAELAERRDPYDYGYYTYYRAGIRARLGDADLALSLLRRAAAEGYDPWYEMHFDPDLYALQGLPAFEEMQRPKG